MKCELVRLTRFSGEHASVYTVKVDDAPMTLFENFIAENRSTHKSELNDILSRLHTIGKHTGAREGYFKHKEGSPGDGLVALYDDPEKKLRLYAIRYGTGIIIVGGGGPKNVRALQDDPKLKAENYFLRQLSDTIKQKTVDRDIRFSEDRLFFEGELEFEIETHE